MKRFYFFIIPLLLQSCSSMYIPSVRSIPLLEKKGEFQGEAGASTNSVYVNGAYALSNDIAVSISGNMSYRNFSDRYDLFTDVNDLPPAFTPDTRGEFAHRYGEISVGKINLLSCKRLKVEAFGGTGIGRATDFEFFNYKSDYYSFFGQGNFGVKRKIVEAGASIRLAYSVFDYVVNKKVIYKDEFSAFHIEPMGFVRVGGENLKAVFRIGLNFAFPIGLNGESGGYRGFDPLIGKWGYTPLHFSIGISYRIAGKQTL